ncbi:MULTISPECIES: FAD-dependent monooxygenase [Pseudonocardia]|uniref:FAD-binding domain-containing protein n=1 Tax=Pseudonocardia saturnea TaxID=33909 RepID=A0ABQ0RUT3_9PSEU|nr:hypothetical protein Pdca_25950 [Pseudonocardia autotrophica]GEC24442.1 hypothetical protein PSA01_14710 [Pseudonocardia saturnea]
MARRACDRFGDPRVFIAGDACHRHSAEAGRGHGCIHGERLEPRDSARDTARPEILRPRSTERAPARQPAGQPTLRPPSPLSRCPPPPPWPLRAAPFTGPFA